MEIPLSLLLTRRYPELYGSAAGPNGFPFDTHDGWFGILDALSEVIVWRAKVDGRIPKPVQQVKEKLGTLRFYFGNTEVDEGAIDMAEEMSARVCEVTGRPGRLGSRRGWRATRAPGLDGIVFAETGLDDYGRMGVPDLGLTTTDVRRWRADVLATADPKLTEPTLAVPEGWLDLVDGLLRQLAHDQGAVRSISAGIITLKPVRSTYDASIPVRVHYVGVGPSGSLQVHHVGGSLLAKGIIAMAVALSRRLDPVTGASKPPSQETDDSSR